jgi:hypothetical protein
MIVTEEEAKTKICHRILKLEKHINIDDTTGGGPCVASECMAWRWFKDKEDIQKGFCGIAHHVSYW